MKQYHAVLDGQKQGPASEEELREWIAQGQLKSNDFVWSEGMSNWAPAGSIPELASLFASNPGVPPTVPSGAPGGTYLQSHRGRAILTLGILGMVICIICGIIAWVMGNNDLREMDAGRMDPAGRGMTRAGRICGMISVILTVVGLGLYILFV